MSWSSPLAFPMTIHDGRNLRTLREAGDLFLSFGEATQRHDWNQSAAEKLVKGAKSARPDDIEDATWEIHRALKRELMLR